jgi:hypothetical protein
MNKHTRISGNLAADDSRFTDLLNRNMLSKLPWIMPRSIRACS